MAKHAGASAIRIENRYAALHVARMNDADAVIVPDAPFSHLFVARGNVDLEGVGVLNEGDAVRLTDIGGQQLTGVGDAEVLIWECTPKPPEHAPRLVGPGPEPRRPPTVA
jgi:redox-sensitive bicupin YhaK (pirin superfamily)